MRIAVTAMKLRAVIDASGLFTPAPREVMFPSEAVAYRRSEWYEQPFFQGPIKRMPESSPLTVAVGDRVVYPNQGVCRVSAVDAKEVAGQKLIFVTMKREEDGAVVMVPQAKIHSIGLRRVASREDVNKVFAFLKSDSDKANLDWKQRARTNSDRMTSGGIIGLAEVVKGLQVLSELRPLPTKERELYDNARHLLVSEIAAALSISDCDAEDSIDLVLFPPGRERPKRTAEEFRLGDSAGPEGDDLQIGEDVAALGDDLPLDAEEAEEEHPEDQEEKAEAAPIEEAPKPARGKAAANGAKPTPRKPKARAPALAKAKDRLAAPKKRSSSSKSTETHRPRPGAKEAGKKKKK